MTYQNTARNLSDRTEVEVINHPAASQKTALYVVINDSVQSQKRTPFRLRAYLPNSYLSHPRGRRAGRYA